MPPRRAKRPVSPGEYTPEELAEVEDFERRYPEESLSSPSSSSEDEEITSAAPSTASSPARDAIPRLTPEKRRTIQLQKARQGLGAQAAELKAIRKATNRVGSRRCRICQLTCNSAAALRFHLESSSTLVVRKKAIVASKDLRAATSVKETSTTTVIWRATFAASITLGPSISLLVSEIVN